MEGLQRIIVPEAKRITSELKLLKSLSFRANAEGYLVVNHELLAAR